MKDNARVGGSLEFKDLERYWGKTYGWHRVRDLENTGEKT